MKKNMHIVPGNNGWNVKSNGNVISTHQTQGRAIDSGRQWAKVNQTELVIHGRDGKIRDKISYGNDPFPPRG